ncbi:MAG: hypothetical protein JWR80_1044 [Bradyrhizobium sp.]|nr:hypothetical protein [Bradyrhizobium sp.]
MKISNVRRGAGQPVVAWFDLEIETGIRIYDIALKRNASGDLRVFAPSPGSKHIVTFGIEFADRIIAMAEAEMGGRTAYGKTKAAA